MHSVMHMCRSLHTHNHTDVKASVVCRLAVSLYCNYKLSPVQLVQKSILFLSLLSWLNCLIDLIIDIVSAYCVAGLGELVKWPSAMTSATCCKIVPCGRTKLRNKNYNATLNPRNEICTLLAVVFSYTALLSWY